MDLEQIHKARIEDKANRPELASEKVIVRHSDGSKSKMESIHNTTHKVLNGKGDFRDNRAYIGDMVRHWVTEPSYLSWKTIYDIEENWQEQASALSIERAGNILKSHRNMAKVNSKVDAKLDERVNKKLNDITESIIKDDSAVYKVTKILGYMTRISNRRSDYIDGFYKCLEQFLSNESDDNINKLNKFIMNMPVMDGSYDG